MWRAIGESMLNTSLVRMHLGIAACYLCVVLFIVYAVVTTSSSRLDRLWILGAIAALPIGLHLCAAQGARKGAEWGKFVSRVLGVVLLIGFPIGTVLGGLVLVKTSAKDWQS